MEGQELVWWENFAPFVTKAMAGFGRDVLSFREHWLHGSIGDCNQKRLLLLCFYCHAKAMPYMCSQLISIERSLMF